MATDNSATNQSSTALAVREPEGPHAIVPTSIHEAMALSGELAKSSLIDQSYRAKAADILHIVMAGMELGVPPLGSLRIFYVETGMPKLFADGLVAIVMGKPSCEYFRCIETTEKVATFETKRRGDPPLRLSYTIETAQRAGLLTKPPWKADPAAMLRARCKAQLAKLVYPDLCAGIPVVGEDDFETAPETTFVPAPQVTAPAAPNGRQTRKNRSSESAKPAESGTAPIQSSAAAPPADDVIDAEYTDVPTAAPAESTAPHAGAETATPEPAPTSSDQQPDDFGTDEPETTAPVDQLQADFDTFCAQVDAVTGKGPAAVAELAKVREAWLEWSKRPDVKARDFHKKMAEPYGRKKAAIS